MSAALSISGAKRLQHVVAVLRAIGLLPVAEWFRLHLVVHKQKDENADFLRANPDFVPPPLEVLHDAFSTVSYARYLETGKLEAEMIASLIKVYRPSARKVLEWGCGPARILRHLPQLLPDTELYGADYNKQSIGWCQKALPHIRFASHDLAPPLPFDDKFDVIYAISVITHLSVEQQTAWIDALRKSLTAGGILIITTHGEKCYSALLPGELKVVQEKGVLVRAGVEEGKRCYTSYHRPDYVQGELFKGMVVRQHIANNPCAHTAQEIWVVQE